VSDGSEAVRAMTGRHRGDGRTLEYVTGSLGRAKWRMQAARGWSQ
jgi:hypothetical protein